MKRKILEILKRTKFSQRELIKFSEKNINSCLLDMASSIKKNAKYLLKENSKDLKEAKLQKKPSAFLDRLALDERRIKSMAQCLEEVSSLKTPVGRIISGWKRPNGLLVEKVRIPLGVIAIIYEARPNVTSDCVGLCLKSFNGLILRGGSASFHSNMAIVEILKQALEKNKLPADIFNYIPYKGRDAVKVILRDSRGLIDVVIPRGGESLIKTVEAMSKIPVIKHYKGVCHVYVDKFADLDMAVRIVYNAKVQRPGVCNACETLLVHKDVAPEFLPRIYRKFKESGVEMRGCELTRKILPYIEKATRKDWYEEYLSLIISIRVVESLSQAIEHINTYGSGHSDAIVTQNCQRARRFLEEVDSCAVYHNASTRFTDGYEFGLGAEMGISTERLHARGPMALEELTTYKWVIWGEGQIRK